MKKLEKRRRQYRMQKLTRHLVLMELRYRAYKLEDFKYLHAWLKSDSTPEAKVSLYAFRDLCRLFSLAAQSLRTKTEGEANKLRPPLNAEYLLYFFLRQNEREPVIGDLIEEYDCLVQKFTKRRADLWYYKQVINSLFPLLWRMLVKVGAVVWLGRIVRRLIS